MRLTKLMFAICASIGLDQGEISMLIIHVCISKSIYQTLLATTPLTHAIYVVNNLVVILCTRSNISGLHMGWSIILQTSNTKQPRSLPSANQDLSLGKEGTIAAFAKLHMIKNETFWPTTSIITIAPRDWALLYVMVFFMHLCRSPFPSLTH